MAISIPALVDAQLAALQAALRPHVTVATNTASRPVPPYGLGNRVADWLTTLTNLIDSAVLTATGGTANSLVDTGAFTGVNSLVGATVVFEATTTTVLLRSVRGIVASNTVNDLVFGNQVWDASGDRLYALPATPAAGDTYQVDYTTIDTDLAILAGNKGLGSSQSNPYGAGPSMVNALMKLIVGLGGSLPSYLDAGSAQPFGLMSPHAAGGGQWGHGGADLLADALEVARDTVAAYTAPA